MSSTDKTKFNIEETSKQSSDEIVSDKIMLAADTTDHLVVATVPTAAGCTSDVNIELEMSPNGESWCPVQILESSVTAGQSTSEIIGNENYVDLTQSAPIFNRYAKGNLNYDQDTSGGQTSQSPGQSTITVPEGTGTYDFMYSQIAVNKCFNHSMWINSDIQPSTTYKPVLFRHGGHDAFENTKVIQTDGTSNTQNLCDGVGATPENGNAVETSSVGTGSPRGGIIQDDSTFDLTTSKWSVGVWFKCNTNVGTGNSVPSIGTATQTVLITPFKVSTNAPYNNYFGGLTAHIVGTDLRVGWFNGTNAMKYAIVDTDIGASILDGNWHHLLICKTTTSQDISTNIGLRFFIDGSEITGYTLGGNLSSIANIADKAVIGYGHIVNAASTHNTHYYSYSFLSIGKMDNACFWKSDQSSNASTIYNSGKPETNPTGSPYAHLRFEDSNDLALNSVTGSTVSLDTAAAASWLIQQSSLANTESIYVSASPTLNNLFTTSSNLSISGWFKTTADATGTLFSNTGGAAASGMTCEVTGNNIGISFKDGSPSPIVAVKDVNDGEWHHLVVTKNTSQEFKIYVDGVLYITSTATGLTDTDLKGSNGFTLLGDGQNNANATNPSATDTSKLNASLSNWSIHSEVLDEFAVKQLYSNGHVRNIKNLPDVDPLAIEAFWQLNDTTNPENDLSGNNYHLQYQDANSTPLSDPSILVDATGAVLVEDSINGNAITLSLTKNFDFVNEVWVSDASGEAAFCLSFNGHEEQAEYVALWKCNQLGLPSGDINVLDGGWHNVSLHYRGRDSYEVGGEVSEGDTVKFGPGHSAEENYNITLSIDGYPMAKHTGTSGADYIGGLGTLIVDNGEPGDTPFNAGFEIYNRHLTFIDFNNINEVYKPHGQFGAAVHPKNENEQDIHAFRGSVDDTSFHSDCFWKNQSGTGINPNLFNHEMTYTLYGRTTSMEYRGANKRYNIGTPYPLLNPELLHVDESLTSTSLTQSNQFINPVRKGDIQSWDNQVSKGGLEAWWRWGDTAGDCSETIKDVDGHANGTNVRHIAAVHLTDQGASSNVQDATGTSIYRAAVAAVTTTGTAITQYVNLILSDISALAGEATCVVKHINTQIMQYIRIKLTGSGTCDIGEDKLKVEIHHKKRRMK